MCVCVGERENECETWQACGECSYVLSECVCVRMLMCVVPAFLWQWISLFFFPPNNLKMSQLKLWKKDLHFFPFTFGWVQGHFFCLVSLIYSLKLIKCFIVFFVLFFDRLESRTKLCSYNLISVPFFFSVGWTKLPKAVFQIILSTICFPVFLFYSWLLNENIFYQSEFNSGGPCVSLQFVFSALVAAIWNKVHVFWALCRFGWWLAL